MVNNIVLFLERVDMAKLLKQEERIGKWAKKEFQKMDREEKTKNKRSRRS